MDLYNKTAAWAAAQGLTLVGKDFDRPWGGFLVLDEGDAHRFAELFFGSHDGLSGMQLEAGLSISPKILMVKPGQRLSWQYHHRRREMWSVVEGPVSIARSATDAEMPPETFVAGDVITLACGERHRLMGLEDWGVVAEFWIHVDPAHPSDEEDIVRVQDDFARK
ncbi:MAG: phosphoheptose isomerase [Cryomorphaceae bacterium BACL7 MAG-120910-bin2]|jgi:mannose-6-phosphate isomerase|nr:MAG: phosphoheptose isomerase [Cryomorphaceae bacterium BACL7 MAG-120910-bin2]|tara:strand:- start:99 stop:593 length:495 start_codon:yes stop_codon:yes gene_type:complete